jgi:arylsulfatase A-like enzyme
MIRSLLLTSWLLLAACAAAPAATPAPPPAPQVAGAHHVVIVTIDGLRPDAITEADMPRLTRLLRESAASRTALAPDPYLTLPSHLAIVTGQTPARHGVRSNQELSREFAGATLFTAVHGAGGRTGLYMGKHKLTALAPRGSADVVAGPRKGDHGWDAGASPQLAAKFAADFPRERYALAFVHLREPDEVGHDAGWMTAPYRAAVAEADRALAVVLRAIADSGLPTTVFVTADHGGEGTDHWTHGAVDWTVPWLCTGPGVKAGTVPGTPNIIDVGTTAAALLGVTLPQAEGKVLKECAP